MATNICCIWRLASGVWRLEVLSLHARYQVDTINETDKKDGFITTAFTPEQLTALITKENGLFLALQDDRIVAYAMAASWGFWSQWPMFALAQMAVKYTVLVTFVNKINPRSLAAHTQKAKLDVLQEFDYNNNHYYELVCLTHR